MKKKLDEKLVKDFPLLYADRNKDIGSTAMCWGFDCDDGWEPILRDLSSKLEPMIKKFYEDHKDEIGCSGCGCDRKEHYASSTSSPGKCLAICRLQTKHAWCKYGNFNHGKVLNYLYHRLYMVLKQKVVNAINYVLGLFFHKLQTCC